LASARASCAILLLTIAGWQACEEPSEPSRRLRDVRPAGFDTDLTYPFLGCWYLSWSVVSSGGLYPGVHFPDSIQILSIPEVHGHGRLLLPATGLAGRGPFPDEIPWEVSLDDLYWIPMNDTAYVSLSSRTAGWEARFVYRKGSLVGSGAYHDGGAYADLPLVSQVLGASIDCPGPMR
jgi:hypothetical protein